MEASLRSHAPVIGEGVSRDVSHMILFYAVGETCGGSFPATHRKQPITACGNDSLPNTTNSSAAIGRRIWMLTMEQAIDQIVRRL
jgi:hypothetical protein